jgi:hypothetical protein
MGMKIRPFDIMLILALGGGGSVWAAEGPWRFAASGDSRNCGDVVMPAVAASVLQKDVAFYWHLGDFRLMSGIDEDMTARYGPGLTLEDYQRDAWGDFLTHQVAAFGLLPVYLGIGNHELYGHKTTADYTRQFAYWLDRPELRRQRATDDPPSDSLTYYHWQKGHVDFISLDNAAEEGFRTAQLTWLEGVLTKDEKNSDIFTVVVGMHRALPNSLACAHSMNGDLKTPAEIAIKSVTSGRRAYRDLLAWQKRTRKRVYILESHSHFFMERIFETPYWQNTAKPDRGVLPGWIVGTAGAVRYPLPENIPQGIRARNNVAGYLLGTVNPNGEIDFEFQEVTQADVPIALHEEFRDDFITACFQENKASARPMPLPPSCSEQ